MSSFDTYETLITAEEAAELLHVGMNQMYKLLQSGKVSCFRVGRRWKVPRRAVNEFILQQARMKSAGWY